MMKRLAALTTAALLAGSISAGTASAFSDTPNLAAVTSLQQQGIVNGIDSDHFAPHLSVNYAQGIQMIVKAFDLNLDLLRFVKQPLASDVYSSVPDNAWYADAFIFAHYNGLDIPKDVNPNASMTREQFADLLVTALEKKANIPTVKMFIMIADEDQITTEVQGKIQRLLLYKIAELDSDRKFNPKGELTRGEAASWVYNAIRIAAEHAKKPQPQEEVSVVVEKITDDVNKVTLSRGEKPNAGYGIQIDGLRFHADGTATVMYKLNDPQPGQMYAQVITTPTAVTYISSQYKPVLEAAIVN
jgi:hypothetical protein